MRRLLLLATALLVLGAGQASAAGLGLAEVRGPDGSVQARAGDGSFSYPADGSVLTIGSAHASAQAVVLRDVSLLAGRVRVSRIVVPAHGLGGAAVDGLEVQGQVAPSGVPNTLVSLGGPSYLVVLQEAVVPGAGGGDIGVVGLRVAIGDGSYGLPAGTQILVGLAGAARAAAARPAAALPAAILGVEAMQPPTGLLPTSDPVFGPLPSSSIGTRAVALAEQFLGVPYRWAGADPSGFDCSGLMMYVYGQLGIPLTHFSGAQFDEGIPVAPQDLQPGDLVFFEPGRLGPGHEGMYVGNGRFIQAPHTGDVVKISSLTAEAAAIGWVGAVRPIAG